jgi:hypothetical protein
MKELDQNKIVLEFKCEYCEETQTDLMVNVIDNGPPLCLNEQCEDGYHRETELSRAWIND